MACASPHAAYTSCRKSVRGLANRTLSPAAGAKISSRCNQSSQWMHWDQGKPPHWAAAGQSMPVPACMCLYIIQAPHTCMQIVLLLPLPMRLLRASVHTLDSLRRLSLA